MAKVALISGGAKRIGAALVEALHQQGMCIIFQYQHSHAEAIQIQDELNQKRKDSVIAIQADLESPQTYQLLADKTYDYFGRLDVLINNAAGFFPTPVEQATESNWENLMAINAKAPFFLAQKTQNMLKKTQGSIINISDIYADKPLIDYAIYCASKAALNSITLSMAQSFAPEIRVNAIAPGAILAPENCENEMKPVINKTPLKRLGGTESIVKTVMFLIQDASFITGQVINVDGGRTATTP